MKNKGETRAARLMRASLSSCGHSGNRWVRAGPRPAPAPRPSHRGHATEATPSGLLGP